MGNKFALDKRESIHIAPPRMTISSDAAKTGGWGAASQGISTGGTWMQAESQLHINTLELTAAELAIKTFTKGKEVSSIHIQMDNTVVLSYLTKMGGMKSQELNIISKRIWQYLLDPNTPECDSKQGITECKRFQRMETKYQHFSLLGTDGGTQK